MSAGNFLGTLFVSVAFSAMWMVIGAAIDKVGIIFNYTVRVLPSFQDAVNGFTITQMAYLVIPIIVWIGIWVNYAQNEASEAGGFV